MTNPVNIVPKTDNDGSRVGRESRRWSEANIIDIKSQVIHLLSKAVDPSDTSNALYVKDNALYFSGSAVAGISEEVVQQLINNAVSELDFINETDATQIASSVASSLIADAIDGLFIPSTLADVGVNVSGVQDGYVLTYSGGEYTMQPTSTQVSNVLSVSSDGVDIKTIGLQDEDVLEIVGSTNVNIASSYSANGVRFDVSLPSNLTNVKASGSTTADRLVNNRTIALSGATTGQVVTNLGTNATIPTTIPSGKISKAVTAKVGALLYKTKANASNSTLPAISFVLANNTDIMDEPLAVFFPGSCNVSYAAIHSQNGGIPEVSSNGSLRKITKDYEFILKKGVAQPNGSIDWTPISTSGSFARPNVTTDVYPGPFEDIIGLIQVDPALTSISDSECVGVFYSIKTTTYSGYSVVSALSANAYGLSISLRVTNKDIV